MIKFYDLQNMPDDVFLAKHTRKIYSNSILHHNQGQEVHIWNFVDTLLRTIGSALFTAQYA